MMISLPDSRPPLSVCRSDLPVERGAPSFASDRPRLAAALQRRARLLREDAGQGRRERCVGGGSRAGNFGDCGGGWGERESVCVSVGQSVG